MKPLLLAVYSLLLLFLGLKLGLRWDRDTHQEIANQAFGAGAIQMRESIKRANPECHLRTPKVEEREM